MKETLPSGAARWQILSYRRAVADLRALLSGVSEEAASEVPHPKLKNIVWHVGHLAWVRMTYIQELCPAYTGDWQLSAPEWKIYETGSAPPLLPEAYPPLSKLLHRYELAHQAWMNYLSALSEKDLQTTLEGYGEGTPLGDLLTFLSEHEAYHRGQIGLLRTLNGHERVFG